MDASSFPRTHSTENQWMKSGAVNGKRKGTMKRILMTMVCVAALAACAVEPGFTSLFDGKTLEGDKMVRIH